MKKIIYLLIATMSMAAQCTDDDLKICKFDGTVVDYTGLDGCGLLIQDDKGEFFEPYSLPDGMQIMDGDKIKFNYKPVDGASICMKGQLVEVTCLEIVERGNQDGCKDIDLLQDMNSAPQPDIKYIEHDIVDGKLQLRFQYSGCADKDDQELYASMAEMKSLPPQRAAIISFEPQACEALITTTKCYDLSTFKYTTILNLKTVDGTVKIQVP